MGPRCQVIRMGPGCGRPPKEAQNTAPVQQIQPARGPRLESLLEPQWLRMRTMLGLVMLCVMVVMVLALRYLPSHGCAFPGHRAGAEGPAPRPKAHGLGARDREMGPGAGA